jgi:hypothetical protein
VKIEGNRLNFIRRKQSQLRVEHYRGLMDHVQSMNKNQGLKALFTIIAMYSITYISKEQSKN